MAEVIGGPGAIGGGVWTFFADSMQAEAGWGKTRRPSDMYLTNYRILYNRAYKRCLFINCPEAERVTGFSAKRYDKPKPTSIGNGYALV